MRVETIQRDQNHFCYLAVKMFISAVKYDILTCWRQHQVDIRGTEAFGFIFSTYVGCRLCGHHFCYAFLGTFWQLL